MHLGMLDGIHRSGTAVTDGTTRGIGTMPAGMTHGTMVMVAGMEVGIGVVTWAGTAGTTIGTDLITDGVVWLLYQVVQAGQLPAHVITEALPDAREQAV